MKNVAHPEKSTHEHAWRNVFFYLSALMGALALVDFDAGRVAHGLGDAGVACLMLSLMTRFPFLRAIARAESRNRSREELLREFEKLRHAHPWAERVSAWGWLLLLASLILRAVGVG